MLVEVAACCEPNVFLYPVSHFPGTSSTLEYTVPICNQRVILVFFCASIVPILKQTVFSPIEWRPVTSVHKREHAGSTRSSALKLWPSSLLQLSKSGQGTVKTSKFRVTHNTGKTVPATAQPRVGLELKTRLCIAGAVRAQCRRDAFPGFSEGLEPSEAIRRESSR